MFLAHFGVAFAAKHVAPRPSLGTMILAAQLADGIWPILLLAGIERVAITPGITAAVPLDFISYPYSHSLLADSLWAVVLGGAYFAVRRDARGAWWLAALVLSHWVIDAASHRPDVPLWPEGPKIGLGLWYSLPATIVAELAIFGAGLWIYMRATQPRDRLGTWLFAGFAALLSILYLASAFGPPPPSVEALALSSLAGWLFVAWGYWIDRHRGAAA